MQEHATALADAIDELAPRWIERSLRRLAPSLDPAPTIDAARADVLARVRVLLERDVDEQWTTPLALLREVVPLMTSALRGAGVAPVERDDFSHDRFPDDVYGLTPWSWSDVDDDLVDPGIAWGAAKAFTHKQRHAS